MRSLILLNWWVFPNFEVVSPVVVAQYSYALSLHAGPDRVEVIDARWRRVESVAGIGRYQTIPRFDMIYQLISGSETSVEISGSILISVSFVPRRSDGHVDWSTRRTRSNNRVLWSLYVLSIVDRRYTRSKKPSAMIDANFVAYLGQYNWEYLLFGAWPTFVDLVKFCNSGFSTHVFCVNLSQCWTASNYMMQL